LECLQPAPWMTRSRQLSRELEQGRPLSDVPAELRVLD
jgi:hypothetical protein